MMKKIYSAPAITVYSVETAIVLKVSNFNDLDENNGGDYDFSPETGEGEEGEDAGGAW